MAGRIPGVVERAGDVPRYRKDRVPVEVVAEPVPAARLDVGFEPGLVERMVTAMILEYILGVREDLAYDRDEELLARILRFIG